MYRVLRAYSRRQTVSGRSLSCHLCSNTTVFTSSRALVRKTGITVEKSKQEMHISSDAASAAVLREIRGEDYYPPFPPGRLALGQKEVQRTANPVSKESSRKFLKCCAEVQHLNCGTAQTL